MKFDVKKLDLHGDEIEYEADNGFELSEDEEGDEAT
jgi:hypothetical protein